MDVVSNACLIEGSITYEVGQGCKVHDSFDAFIGTFHFRFGFENQFPQVDKLHHIGVEQTGC